MKQEKENKKKTINQKHEIKKLLNKCIQLNKWLVLKQDI
jgi:hypothetical protein